MYLLWDPFSHDLSTNVLTKRYSQMLKKVLFPLLSGLVVLLSEYGSEYWESRATVVGTFTPGEPKDPGL